VRDPVLLIYEALKVAIRTATETQITVKADYPDPSYFKAKTPAVGLLKIGGKARDFVTPGDSHVTLPVNPDGTLPVVGEWKRYSYLLQLSVFTETKRERSELGQTIEEYLQKKRYHALPGDPFGDYTVVLVQGVPHDSKGEVGFYQRDFTLKCSGRLLIVDNFQEATEVIINNQVT